MQPVLRIEAHGEAAIPFPSLTEAMRIGPQGPEGYIATSIHGVHLADAMPVRGPGSVLAWRLTRAGQDVVDRAGWTREAPTLSPAELDTVLQFALREDFEAAS